MLVDNLTWIISLPIAVAFALYIFANSYRILFKSGLVIPLEEGKIKCNFSSSGDKIYHLPGDRLYDCTKINEEEGEFYARTEHEAKAKGFRRSKVR